MLDLDLQIMWQSIRIICNALFFPHYFYPLCSFHLFYLPSLFHPFPPFLFPFFFFFHPFYPFWVDLITHFVAYSFTTCFDLLPYLYLASIS